MAHLNIDERRLAVKQLIEKAYTSKDLMALAIKYGCSYSAVYSDIAYVNRIGRTPIFPSYKKRKAVLLRDNYMCQYCGVENVDLVAEHVIPYILGGVGEPYNLVASCYSCNMKKKKRIEIPMNIDLLKELNNEWYNKIIEMYEKKHRP